MISNEEKLKYIELIDELKNYALDSFQYVGFKPFVPSVNTYTIYKSLDESETMELNVNDKVKSNDAVENLKKHISSNLQSDADKYKSKAENILKTYENKAKDKDNLDEAKIEASNEIDNLVEETQKETKEKIHYIGEELKEKVRNSNSREDIGAITNFARAVFGDGIIAKIFTRIATFLKALWDKIVAAIVQAWNAVRDFFSRILPHFIENLFV